MLHLYVLNVKTMLGLIKFLSSHLSGFSGEQRIQEGHACLLHGNANHLQGLPWRLRGGAGILAGQPHKPSGHASIPAGQPHKPASVALHIECIPHSSLTTTYNTDTILEYLMEEYMGIKAVPPYHPAIP